MYDLLIQSPKKSNFDQYIIMLNILYMFNIWCLFRKTEANQALHRSLAFCLLNVFCMRRIIVNKENTE